jgi:hypothetical protein
MEMIVPKSPSVDATTRYRAAVPQAAPRAMRPPRPKPRSGEFLWHLLTNFRSLISVDRTRRGISFYRRVC